LETAKLGGTFCGFRAVAELAAGPTVGAIALGVCANKPPGNKPLRTAAQAKAIVQILINSSLSEL
jgi:hypothetical protein